MSDSDLDQYRREFRDYTLRIRGLQYDLAEISERKYAVELEIERLAGRRERCLKALDGFGTEPTPNLSERAVYSTANGSTVTLLHPSGRSWSIDWDWCEEGACVESRAQFNGDLEEPAITAACNCGCDGYWSIPLAAAKESA